MIKVFLIFFIVKYVDEFDYVLHIGIVTHRKNCCRQIQRPNPSSKNIGRRLQSRGYGVMTPYFLYTIP